MKKLTFLISFFVLQNARCDSISIGLLGLTSHGAFVEDTKYELMKRKVSKTGYMVWNPEANVTYEHQGWLFNASYINNCYGFDSYFVGVGKQWNITKTFYANAMVGPYFTREMNIHRVHNTDGSITLQYHPISEILLMPMITLGKDFMFTNNFGLFASVSSNYALTHALTGIKYQID